MSKRQYTHVQALLPEIKAMVADGKTQRESAEHFGLKDKYVVKQLLTRERRKEAKFKSGIILCHVPKDDLLKMHHQEISLQNKPMRLIA